MTTPGFSLVNTAEAVEFNQHLTLPTQRNILLGDPAAFANDSDVSSALTNIHGKAKQSAEIIGRLTQDQTRTTPLKHEAASKIAASLIEAAEGTQRLLSNRANDYVRASDEIMASRFKLNAERHFHYDRIADWIGREAKTEGGYAKIREAITDDPDFALTMYNMSHRLLDLPDEHAFNFKTKIIEHWAPEAMEHIETSHKLSQLAKRYPAFTAKVKSSFYSPIELAKVRTRVELPA